MNRCCVSVNAVVAGCETPRACFFWYSRRGLLADGQASVAIVSAFCSARTVFRTTLGRGADCKAGAVFGRAADCEADCEAGDVFGRGTKCASGCATECIVCGAVFACFASCSTFRAASARSGIKPGCFPTCRCSVGARTNVGTAAKCAVGSAVKTAATPTGSVGDRLVLTR